MYYYSRGGGVAGYFSRSLHKALAVALLAITASFMIIFQSILGNPPSGEVGFSVPSPSSSAVVPIPAPVEEKKKVFIDKELSQTIVNWASKYGENASVVLSDEDGNVLGNYNADQSYFAASIYKLYVAYVGYQLVDAGQFNLSDAQWQDWDKEKCLQQMIQTSHSPCAETMMAEIGRDYLQTKLEGYGLKNTSMAGISTTAADVNIILQNIRQGRDLSADSQARLLESMRSQKYRDVIPNGFSASEVYNKVGFRDHDEYHDVAIIELEDGRVVTLSMFTNGVGVYPMYQLTQSLNTQLN